jgi:hypothetical protein
MNLNVFVALAARLMAAVEQGENGSHLSRR